MIAAAMAVIDPVVSIAITAVATIIAAAITVFGNQSRKEAKASAIEAGEWASIIKTKTDHIAALVERVTFLEEDNKRKDEAIARVEKSNIEARESHERCREEVKELRDLTSLILENLKPPDLS